MNEILTQAGYLKPLTFVPWLGCWKWSAPGVAISEETVFTGDQEKKCLLNIYCTFLFQHLSGLQDVHCVTAVLYVEMVK